MKYFITLLTAVALMGCGVSPLQDEMPKLTGAVLISEGDAGLLIAPFAGNVNYCKYTEWGTISGLKITYKGVKCRVTIPVPKEESE